MGIGVFGGTFDPIHLGHLHVARQARELFELDEVYFVVSLIPPHKSPRTITSPYHRYAMCAMAINDIDGFNASTAELEDPENPYTIDTLRKFSARYNKPIFFIIGADSFVCITYWKDYETLLTSYNVIAVDRPQVDIEGYEKNYPRFIVERLVDVRQRSSREIGDLVSSNLEKGHPRTYIARIGAYDISSTEIRRKIKEGESVEPFVPSCVRTYIKKHRLYGD